MGILVYLCCGLSYLACSSSSNAKAATRLMYCPQIRVSCRHNCTRWSRWGGTAIIDIVVTNDNVSASSPLLIYPWNGRVKNPRCPTDVPQAPTQHLAEEKKINHKPGHHLPMIAWHEWAPVGHCEGLPAPSRRTADFSLSDQGNHPASVCAFLVAAWPQDDWVMFQNSCQCLATLLIAQFWFICRVLGEIWLGNKLCILEGAEPPWPPYHPKVDDRHFLRWQI